MKYNGNLDDSYLDDKNIEYFQNLLTNIKINTTPMIKKSEKTKGCLGCGEGFESEGKHNRLCDCCRKENGIS